MAEQKDWRYCGKCHGLFFDGYPEKGTCPAGNGHDAIGYNFVLPHDVPGTPTAQDTWRYCGKCHGLFFDGYPEKGTCPAGNGHDAIGYNFVLPHDVPGTPIAQDAWRYCGKCHGIFYDGYPEKGTCPAGGGHDAIGYNFVLPHPALIRVTPGVGSFYISGSGFSQNTTVNVTYNYFPVSGGVTAGGPDVVDVNSIGDFATIVPVSTLNERGRLDVQAMDTVGLSATESVQF